jgi:hypothetical protein
MGNRFHQRRDPYWITAKRDDVCGCGRGVEVGDRVMWFPREKAVECGDCGRKTASLLEDDDMNQRTHTM